MKRPTLTWKAKLPLLLVLFSLGPLAIIAAWADTVLTSTFEDTTLDSMSAIARNEADAIERFTEDRKTQVERIAQLVAPRLAAILDAEGQSPRGEVEPPPDGLPALADGEALPPQSADAPDVPDSQAVATPEPEPGSELHSARAELRQTLGLILWDQREFEEILAIDTDGRVVASTFEGHEGRTAAELAYFRGGLRTTHVQPIFVSPITERLTMVIATPLRTPQSELIGVLAARLNLSQLFGLINDRSGLGETGETIVVELNGDDLVFIAPTRHDAMAAFARRIPAATNGNSSPLYAATRGQDGSGRIIDYRGECCFAAWESIPSLGWGLATKIDCREALAPVREARTELSVLGALLVLVAVLAALVVAQGLVRPLRTLKMAADRLSKGDFDVQVDVGSRDEIGELAESFERMVAGIKFFREHSNPEDEVPEDSASEPVGQTEPVDSHP